MDTSHSTIHFTLTFLLLLLPSSKPVSDYTTLVYKTCATQTFNHHQLFQTYSQTLDSLFQQLVAQSSQHKFFKTMEAVTDDTAISGLFQCRDDISKEDCFTCVNTLPHMSNTLCSGSTSARVQLHGCYMHYETEEVPQTTRESDGSSNILLHKNCGEPVGDYIRFKEMMDEAFLALESGILNSNGYYITDYKSVKLMAQCEGDSDTCDCSNCINDAVQAAREECTASLSAQIYLQRCFISYGMHVPGTRRNNNTVKLAAIVVGGAAALLLGFILLSLLISRFRKNDYE